MTDFDSLASGALSEQGNSLPASEPAQSFVQTTPAVSSLDYDSLAKNAIDGEKTDAQRINASLINVSPDKAAKANELGKQYNLPGAAITPNLEQWTQKSELDKSNGILQDNHHLASWVLENSGDAAVAKDDFDKLDSLSKIAVTLARTGQPILENRLGRKGTDLELENLTGNDTDKTQEDISGLKQDVSGMDIYQPTGTYKRIETGLNFAVNLADNIVHALPVVASMATAGASTGGLPGAAVGASVGLGGGIAMDMAKVSAGQTYLQLNDVRDKNNQPLPEYAKQIGAGLVSALNFGIGLVGVGAQGKALEGVAQNFIQDGVKDALTRPTVISAIKNVTKNAIIGSGEGALMMGGMALASQAGQEIAKQIAPGDWNTVLNNPELRTEYVKQVSDAVENGMVLIGALHGIGGVVGEYGKFQQSTSDIQMFNNLADGSVESKTRTRSPATFQTFMQSQVQNTPVENIYIPAEKVNALYAKAGIAPSAEDNLFGKVVPNIGEQMEQGLPLKGDIIIPTADYTAHIAGTPLDKALRNDLRVRQDGMSVNDQIEFKNKYQDILSKIGEQFKQQQQESDVHTKIFEDMHEKAVQAGFRDSEATKYATLVAAKYATRAQRLGVDPFDLYRETGLQVRRGQVGEAPEAALNAFPVKKAANEITLDDLEKEGREQIRGNNQNINELLDYVKGDKQLPKEKKPVTLADFISKIGGIKNEGEEFHAAETNKLQKGLIRKTGGRSHDEAAQAAWEAGYIGGKDIRPDINTFLDSLKQDLANRNVLKSEDIKTEPGLHEQVKDLSDYLDQHNIEYKDKDKIEIIKEMQDKGLIGGHPTEEFSQSDRAKVTMAEGQHIITLFSRSDKSSLLHELGHIWLEELKADSMREDAPAQLKEDWEQVKKYIGHNDGAIKTESHEIFAKSFEQYLMEGKSPSNILQSVFRSFKQWLTKIYKTADNLGVEINPEIRQVFDRMVATDEEIAEMETRQHVNQLFRTKEEAGMTDEEFKDYNKKAVNIQQAAREQLLTEAMEDLKKKDTTQWNKAYNGLKPEITKQVESRQDIRTLDWFKTGKLRDAEGKEIELPRMEIDKNALEQLYPGAELPKDIKVSDSADAVHPDDLASLLGYDSGKDLINDLVNLGKEEKEAGRRDIKNYLIDKEIDEQLRNKYHTSEEELRHKAEGMINDVSRFDLKLAELRALSRKSGQPVIFTKENVGAWADSQIGGMKVLGGANVYQFMRVAAKAGRDATRAITAGKDDEAIQALQAQTLNMAMADRARKVADNYAGGMKLFKYAASKPVIKSVEQSYLNHIHSLLSDFGFKVNRDAQELQNSLQGQSLHDFVTEKRDEERGIYAPDFLFNTIQKDISSLTVDEFAALKNSVNSLLHNAREEKTILTNEKKIAMDELRAQIVAQRRPGEKINVETLYEKSSEARSPLKNLGDAAIKFLSSLRRSEDIIQALDNDKVLGPYQNSFFTPLSVASDREMNMLADEKTAWDNLRNLMPKDWEDFLNKRIPADDLIDRRTGQPHEFSGGQVIAIALNIGNASNLDKMLRGEKWSETAVRTFLNNNLEKHHWDMVQGIIDRFEHHWPATEALYRKLNGIAPVKIEATPIQTQFGTYPGGYFPVMYDAARTAEIMTKDAGAKIDSDSPIGKPFSFLNSLTSSGRTITRTKAAYPLLYDLNMVVPKLNEAIHDLAFREAIINANKFLRDKTIASEIQQRSGMDSYQQLQNHVKDIAQPYKDDSSLEGMNKVISNLRKNTVAVGVLFRVSTIIKHFSAAFSQSTGELGVEWMAHGLREFWSDPSGLTKFAYENSTFMRTRMDNIDIDQRKSFNQLRGESGINQAIRIVGHYGVGLSDQATAIPTWKAAYDKASSEGKSTKDALLIADQSVRNAHGASRLTDIPAFLRGDEFVKIFTPFYTFMNHVYNRGVLRTGRSIKYGLENLDTGNKAAAMKDFNEAIARTFFYFMVPGFIIGQALPSDKKSDWVTNAAKGIGGEVSGTVPFIRSMIDAAERGRGVSFSPLGRAIDTVIGTGKDVASATGLRDKEVNDKWLQHAMDTVGYTTGVPIGGQPAQTAQFLWDVSSGVQRPHDTQEWIHGLTFGKARD